MFSDSWNLTHTDSININVRMFNNSPPGKALKYLGELWPNNLPIHKFRICMRCRAHRHEDEDTVRLTTGGCLRHWGAITSHYTGPYGSNDDHHSKIWQVIRYLISSEHRLLKRATLSGRSIWGTVSLSFGINPVLSLIILDTTVFAHTAWACDGVIHWPPRAHQLCVSATL